jgi:hypothetical protein
MSEELENKNPNVQENTGEIIRDEKGRFVPGVSGNPEGRPKFSLVSILKEELQNIPENRKVSRALSIIRKIADQAENGDAASQKLIMNYIDGMPRQNIGLGGEKDGEPIIIQWQK